LALVLVQYQNVSILSSIATSGSQERKIPPGLLFLVFKQGIVVEQPQHAEQPGRRMLCQTMSLLLEAVHGLLLHHDKLVFVRVLADVVSSRESLSHLVHLASLAPSLTDYEAVLQCRDEYGDSVDASLELEQVGIVARRLLFCLLADRSHSPLLALKAIAGQSLVRAMLVLMSSPGVAMQLFLVHCLEVTPQLLEPLFRLLPIPDCSSCLPFCKTMRFLVRVLRSKATLDENSVMWRPTHLKKQHLTKALQSSNPLVVSAALQFLAQVLKRTSIDAVTKNHLPEPSAVVRVLASGRWGDDPKCLAIVAFSACQVIPRLVQLAGDTSAMDWVKCLVPNNAFSRSLLWLQHKLLACLEQILQQVSAVQ
jgi:hypothetical protein